MQKVYRFLIVRALANAVFEAHDETSGATVSLYQWTPPIEDRENVRKTLDTIEDTIEGEVFSADASLYLVGTSPTEAAADLRTLRKAGLFTGRWLNEDSPPPARQRVVEEHDLPVVPPPRPSPAPPYPVAETRRKPFWTGAKVFFTVLLFAGIAAWIGSAISAASQDSEVNQLRSDLSNKVNTASSLQDQLKPYQRLHLLRFKNACDRNLRVAIRYQSYTGSWVTQGWWHLKQGETALLAVSPSKDFLVYAQDASGTFWSNKVGKDIEIVQAPFAYAGSAPSTLQDETPTTVHTMLMHGSAPSEDPADLDCPAIKAP